MDWMSGLRREEPRITAHDLGMHQWMKGGKNEEEQIWEEETSQKNSFP